MRGVVFALLPIAAFAVWQFGLSALLLLVTTTGVAMAIEVLFARRSGIRSHGRHTAASARVARH